jgi:hypothetical protein
MNQVAQTFLARCFAPAETIALLLRSESPEKVKQRVVRLEKALAPKYLAWLAYENQHGANVYVAMNPLRAGSRKRTKQSIECVRHLYLDIDCEGDEKLTALRASDAVPTPTAILSTSPGKYQVLWHVEGFDFDQQELTLRLLANAFGGDPACTDCNRVLRIPGFLNCKYDPAWRVTVVYPDDSIWTSGDFHLAREVAEGRSFRHTLPPQKSKHSNSEMDWAWVTAQLAHGADAMKLTRELASRRSDKPNPLYYAQRTIDVASAHLWLLEGIRINDVITMLEVRRRFEFPQALCATRAREIAATAERMVACKRTA